jgi:predicted ArsR family transcriptional regulator
MAASVRTDQKWSAELIRKMAKLADQEMSAAQIAKALGLTRGQVLGKMHRLGLKTKTSPRKKWLTTALVEKLTELIGQRLSANEIGQELGLTRPQVRYRMQYLGFKMKRRFKSEVQQCSIDDMAE